MTQTANAPVKVVLTKAVKIEKPALIMIHGEAGVGKSTLASKAPGVVFVPTEGGSDELEVRRALVTDGGAQREPRTFEEFETTLKSLVVLAESGTARETFKWVCVDTVDALEQLIHDHVATKNGKTSITDIGYAKGYDYSVEVLRKVLALFERLQRAGVGTILLAHSEIKKFNNPEGADFDFYDIKCHKKFSGLLVQFCGDVLFARREQAVSVSKTGKTQGVGTQTRFLCTQKTPTYVAKNRHDLPERLPMSWYALEKAMKDHKPANPTLLREECLALIERLPENKEQATERLEEIHAEDARELARFLDYIRGRVATETKEEETPNEQ